jgi:hypothetical protein
MTIYRCKSPTCMDNGGVCELKIPEGYESPTSCVNPELFLEECDCKWEEIQLKQFNYNGCSQRSPCWGCASMREYFPGCQQNCGMSKPQDF